jgi:Ca2+-binding EF-hand superfamily protein
MKKFLPSLALGLAFAALTSCTTTTSTSTTATTDRFAIADVNHDGKLSPAEGRGYIVHQVFTARDANHDGKLTWAEWNVPGSGRSRARFDAADTNKDGSISMEEAAVAARERGLFKENFEAADTNHDGFVTRAEGQAYYGSTEGPPR